MAIREGRWDCPSCGSKAVYGRHVDCPGCGKPRPAGIRFYLTSDAPAIVDAAQLAEARAGADWVCEHCAATNRAMQDTCGGCGAPRGTSPTQPVTGYALGQVPRSGDAPPPAPAAAPAVPATAPAAAALTPAPAAAPAATDAPAPAPPAADVADASGARRSRIGMLAATGFTLFLFALGAIGIAREPRVDDYRDNYVPTAAYELPDEVQPIVVEATRWRRDVEVEERRLVPGAGWSLPGGALMLSNERRHRGQAREVERYVTTTRTRWVMDRIRDGYETHTREVSERVQTGTRTYTCGARDLGNGYFEDVECTEPTYGTRTRTETYEVPKYRSERRLDTIITSEPIYRTVQVYGTWYTWNMPVWTRRIYRSEGDTTRPGWPGVELGPDRRLRSRSEKYFITLRADQMYGEEIEMPFEEWSRYRVGQRLAFRWESGERILLPADSLPACTSWHAGQGAAPPDSLGCSPRPDSLRADSVRADSVRADSVPPDSQSEGIGNRE